jgi:hypothetical protein
MKNVGILARTSIVIAAGFLLITETSYATDLSVAGVTLEDKRPEARKKKVRSSVMSPIVTLGDDTLNPSGLVRFQEALKKVRGRDETLSVIVDDFAVIDYFPKRMNVVTSGGSLVDSIAKHMVDTRTDWKMVEEMGLPPDSDAIICLFAGQVDGKPVTVATFSSYKISMMTVSVRGSKPFKDAVADAIEKAAKNSLSSN